MNDLTVDISIHEAIGMRVISTPESEYDRKRRCREAREEADKMEWPKDELFNPIGITMEEAQKAVDMMYR